MRDILKKITPTLRELRFKGTGQNYHRIEKDTVSIVNFQKSAGGLRFYINLGVRPLCLVPVNEDPKKSKEYDCIFRDRIDPPNNSPGWSYQLSEPEIDDLRKRIQIANAQFFEPLSQIRRTIQFKPIHELICDEPSIYGGYHATTCKHFAEMALHYGATEKSKGFANKGIELCKPQATRLLAELQKLANHSMPMH